MKTKKTKTKDKIDKRIKPEAILRHRLFVPTSLVTEEMKELFTDSIPDALPPTDEFGDEVLDRTLYVEGWKHHKKLGYTSFCRGDKAKIKEVFSDFDIIDETSDVMLKHDIKFTGVPVNGVIMPLRKDQKRTVKIMLKTHYGILQAPPRYGKTTWMTKIITKYRRRTVVFVHQVDLARQLENEFRKCTNINEIERQTGRKLIGLVKSKEELARYEVAICTWQLLHHRPKMLRKHANDFGLMLVDEGHRFASKFSSQVIDRFNTRYRIAVTATPDRKDQRDVIFKQIVGPVTVEGIAEQVPMRVHLAFTGFSPDFSRWTTYMKRCAESKTRNKMCLDRVEKEVKAGQSVLIVTTLRKHIEELVEKLKLRGITAEGFHGGARDREALLRRAANKTTKVVIGMRSMLTGVNVPCWSCIHILMPTANGPGHYQEFSRVRTPYEGKQYATITHYIDAVGAARGCYKTCHVNYVNPKYGPMVFIDHNGNPYRKQPSLKQINEWSQEVHIYKDVEEKKAKRKPTGFIGGKPVFGFSLFSKHRK